MTASEFCYYHHPDYDEKRRKRGSKGGKRAGRGRPVVEIQRIQRRLEELAEDVLSDDVEKGRAPHSRAALQRRSEGDLGGLEGT